MGMLEKPGTIAGNDEDEDEDTVPGAPDWKPQRRPRAALAKRKKKTVKPTVIRPAEPIVPPDASRAGDA